MTGLLHVVPVGTSLLKHLAADRRVSVPLRNALAGGAPLRGLLRQADRGDGRLMLEPLLHADPGQAAAVTAQLQQLTPDHSAELTALDAHDRTRTEPAGPGRDSIVLVATDTDDGLRAAALLAHLLAARTGSLPRYADDPVAAPAGVTVAAGQVLLVRIPGLDLDVGGAPDSRTWLSVGEVGRAVALDLCDTRAESRAIFHLTGGYKALLPYLLLTADAVATVIRCRLGPGTRVTAQVLHETSEQPVRLPVRWLTGTLLERAQDLSRAAGTRDHLIVDDLHDFRGTYLRDEPFTGRRD
ncbi:hypothetical protein [Amycolatopsis sp. CA-128772]|uniref:hypothetical protein n=1 Tax=Amycolatopsis sp. CA-128772 TaxID=2073159 RepID=UPI000CD19DAA|nr:hypothetical protein [Amycolatopsis sp. CA-128772]